MHNDTKHKLLANVLSGKTDGLHEYRENQTVDNLNIRLVINRQNVGGPIEITYGEGINEEISLLQFEALPRSLQTRTCTIHDYSGGRRILPLMNISK